MLPYIIISLLLLFFVIKFDIKGDFSASYTRAEKSVMIILILFAGLRNRVGGDTINYEVLYHSVPPINEFVNGLQGATEKDMLQPLWFFFNCLFRTFTDNFVWFQLFVAIVFNTLIFRFVDKTTKYRFSAVFFFFFISWWNLSFEVLRESICVALFANSLLALNDGDIRKYLLWNMPAIFIHWFSLPIIVLALVIKYMSNKILVPLSLAVGLYCMLVVNPDTILKLTMLYGSIIGESGSSFLDMYLSDDSLYGFSNLNIYGIISALIKSFLPAAILISKKTRSSVMEKVVILFISISLINYGVPIVSRFLNYLYIVMIVLAIENLYEKKRNNSIKISKFICAVFLFILCINSIKSFYLPYPSMSHMSYNAAHIPYTSVFQEPNPVRENLFGK